MKPIQGLRIFGWVSLPTAIWICVALPMINADWITKGHPDYILHEDSLFEQFQWPWYFAAAAVMLWAARRTDVALRPYLWATSFVAVILGQREGDWDLMLFGQRWYNLARYLSPAEPVPMFGRVALSVIFLIVVGCVAWWVIRHRQVLGLWYARPGWRPSHLLFGAAVALCCVSIAFDKWRTIHKHTGVDLRFGNRVYMEEVAELCAAILIFIAAVEISRLAATRSGARDE